MRGKLGFKLKAKILSQSPPPLSHLRGIQAERSPQDLQMPPVTEDQ